MARKSIGGAGTPPLVAGKAAVPPTKVRAKTPAGLRGSKVSNKTKASKGGKRTLKTLGGTSGIMNPPAGGGYS
jgi:hypothetical protein